MRRQTNLNTNGRFLPGLLVYCPQFFKTLLVATGYQRFVALDDVISINPEIIGVRNDHRTATARG